MKVKRTEYYILIMAVNNYAEAIGVNVYEMNSTFSERTTPRKYGVNWSAQGTQEPEQAVEYALNIAKAARLADALNGFELVVDYKEDGNITREELDQTLEQIELLLKFEQWNQLARYLESAEV